jgi:hypothetical protein
MVFKFWMGRCKHEQNPKAEMSSVQEIETGMEQAQNGVIEMFFDASLEKIQYSNVALVDQKVDFTWKVTQRLPTQLSPRDDESQVGYIPGLLHPFADSHSHSHKASFQVNTMRYKGKDSASGIGRKLPIIRPGATVSNYRYSRWSNNYERADKSNVRGEYKRASSQTNGSEHTIASSILTDLIFKRSNGRKAVSSNSPVNQRSSRVRATSFKNLN